MENDDFVKWANENIVVVVAHQDDGHKPESPAKDAKNDEGDDPDAPKDDEPKPDEEPKEDGGARSDGGADGPCPLYPGLSCAEHRTMGRDLTGPPEGLPKIEAPEGVPSSWLIAPNGEVRPVTGANQQSAGKIQEIAEAWQKDLGDHVPWKKWEKYQAAFQDGDAAVEKGDWKAALKAYGTLDAALKKLPDALGSQLQAKVEVLREKTSAAWAEVRDGEGDVAAKQKAAKDLLAKVGQRLSSGPLPVKAEIEAWLKENAAKK
jgi:hypothetical protein